MQRRGFTLIELLIVTAAFSVIFLVATTVYSRSFQQQKHILATQRNSSDARYLMETIARAARIGTIYYPYYGVTDTTTATDSPLRTAQTSLAVANEDGTINCFLLSAGKIKLSTSTSQVCDAATAVDITPTDVTITGFYAYMMPTTNPFQTTAPAVDVQPHVTLQLRTQVTQGREVISSTLNTTVTSRLYKR